MVNHGIVLPNGRNSYGMTARAIYYATYGKFPPKPEPRNPSNAKYMPAGVKFIVKK